MDTLERQFIEKTARERLEKEYPGAKGGRVLSKAYGFICDIQGNSIKIYEDLGLYKQGKDAERVYW